MATTTPPGAAAPPPAEDRARGFVAPPVPPPAPTFSRPTFRPAGPVARWVYAGTALAGTASLAAYLYLVDPNVASNPYPKCPMKFLTGVDCPGCGGLRATHSLVHGDIAGAADHNVLALIIVPLMAYLVLRWTLRHFGKELPRIPSRPFMAWAIPVSVLVFSIVRNIPNTPFYYLNSA